MQAVFQNHEIFARSLGLVSYSSDFSSFFEPCFKALEFFPSSFDLIYSSQIFPSPLCLVSCSQNNDFQVLQTSFRVLKFLQRKCLQPLFKVSIYFSKFIRLCLLFSNSLFNPFWFTFQEFGIFTKSLGPCSLFSSCFQVLQVFCFLLPINFFFFFSSCSGHIFKPENLMAIKMLMIDRN